MPTDVLPSASTSRLRRLVRIEPGEGRALAASFVFFFAVLTAYYIVRPVRDELGVKLGPDGLKHVFGYVFLVMLAAVPVFGWVATRFPRRLVLPIVYAFFATNLAGFWLALESGNESAGVAMLFFVWASVFNLFVVSLFWAVMASAWAPDQAKRLYGFIAAGGTAGAMTGPLITQSLVTLLGPANLLLVSAAFLGLALAAAQVVSAPGGKAAGETGAPGGETPTLASILAGALDVWRSPYLFRIALWVLLANVISTYFYFEQARIVGAAITDRALRVQLFARMDLAVSILSVLMQIFLTARFMERFGLGAAIAALPASAIAGFVAIAAAPMLMTVVVIIVAERAILFGLTNPAARILYTVVGPDEKYKAQSFIDTVVFRGGDAASGWYFDALAKGLGLGVVGIAAVTLPFGAVWLGLSFVLARMFAEREGRRGP